MKLSTMREINPKETTRAYAFELWMKAPMPNGYVFQDFGCQSSC